MNEMEQKGDLELVEAFRHGDEFAFEELVKRYSGKMFQTAYGLLGSSHDAEEVVQDSLLRAYRHFDQFRGDSSFSTWIYRIVVNLSRNKYQWNKSRGSELNVSISDRPDDDGEKRGDFEIADERYEPSAMLRDKESENNLIALMKDLPDKLREVLILRHIEEKSYEEIARMLDCNLGTVKSRISRAREAMVEIIRRERKNENGK